MDYWALGHIHNLKFLARSPRSFMLVIASDCIRKEHGPKGCYLVSVSHNGHSDFAIYRHHAIRFEEIKIDIAGMQN